MTTAASRHATQLLLRRGGKSILAGTDTRQFFTCSQIIHVSLPRSRMRPRKLWRHLGISPKILVETVVLKGSAPLPANAFYLSPSQSLVRESVSKIFLITDYPQPSKLSTNHEHSIVSAGL